MYIEHNFIIKIDSLSIDLLLDAKQQTNKKLSILYMFIPYVVNLNENKKWLCIIMRHTLNLRIIFFFYFKKHTVRTVSKSNWKLSKQAKLILLIHIYMNTYSPCLVQALQYKVAGFIIDIDVYPTS